ncbi:hypothetical protein ABUW04_35910 [Streptacidiphilus sp. N1-10]|uniref:Secreted protein n=1 Tax=Streptacidiphilus jeojiensis TaxID=3229225 RepID=A0ABV6XZE5_9ACTN
MAEHTRSTAIHWIATAAALGGVVAAAVAVSPADAGTVTADGPHSVPAAQAPNPAGIALPLDCDGLPDRITQRFSADTTGHGTVVTVVAARCAAPNGTPPDGLYVLGFGPDGRPRITATLIRPTQNLTVRSAGIRADGSIHATVDGYSSEDVPRCCADLHDTDTWTLRDGGYVLTASTPLAQT